MVTGEWFEYGWEIGTVNGERLQVALGDTERQFEGVDETSWGHDVDGTVEKNGFRVLIFFLVCVWGGALL